MRGPVPAIACAVAAAIMAVRAAVERDRKPVWVLLAAGFCSYAVAFLLWGTWLMYRKNPPGVSIVDAFWLGIYPLLGAALIVATKWYTPRRSRGVSMKMWLDGLLAGTAMVAIGLAVVAPPLLRAARNSHAGVLMILVYPVADLVVGVLIVTLLGIRGWRLDRKWIVGITGYVVWLAADCDCAMQYIHGAKTGNSGATLCYLVAFLLVAATAWQPEVHPDRTESTHWSTLVVPAAFSLAAPTILVYDHFLRVSLPALVVTWISLVVAIVRISVALRDTMSLRDLQRAALTDDLTQLPNRRMFLAKLRQEVTMVERVGGSLTTLMLDLDNFKQLNDTLGHDAGDELLRTIGPRLTDAVGTAATVARLGGDEFAILLEPDTGQLEAEAAVQRVLDSFNEPFRVHGLVLRLTASIGIAAFPHDADSPDTLLKCADVAMYDAKRSRRGFERYSPDRDEYTRERLEMSGELAGALENGEIEAVYQPLVDTDSREIVGAEALVRWRRPDGSLRPPSEFLEAAELAGLSRPLTRHMIGLALDQIRDWRADGHDSLYASVNATVADLLDESFPDELAAALDARGLDADAVKIEVTESSIVANPERIGSVLRRMRVLGIEVALDDFGTGYSSLTHLRELPVDVVKIDRSFVTNMCDDGTDSAIVYAIIELAHRLGLRVVAEGVEDERTWQALRQVGCDRLQGYAFSAPIEPARFQSLLDATRPDHFADSQSLPTPASTASGGSIS